MRFVKIGLAELDLWSWRDWGRKHFLWPFLWRKLRFSDSTDIDRFQVSHFRPVVMEIEIGGRSEKSLGGQESTAVDQECMGSNASSCSFALSFPIFDCLFFSRTCLMSGAANSP